MDPLVTSTLAHPNIDRHFRDLPIICPLARNPTENISQIHLEDRLEKKYLLNFFTSNWRSSKNSGLLRSIIGGPQILNTSKCWFWSPQIGLDWFSSHQSQHTVLIQHSQHLTHLCVGISQPVATEGLVPQPILLTCNQSNSHQKSWSFAFLCVFSYFFQDFLGNNRISKKKSSKNNMEFKSKPGDVKSHIFFPPLNPPGNDHISHQTGKGKSSTQKCLFGMLVPRTVDVHRCFCWQYVQTCTWTSLQSDSLLSIPSGMCYYSHQWFHSPAPNVPWPSLQAFLLSLSSLTVDILIVLISQKIGVILRHLTIWDVLNSRGIIVEMINMDKLQ